MRAWATGGGRETGIQHSLKNGGFPEFSSDNAAIVGPLPLPSTTSALFRIVTDAYRWFEELRTVTPPPSL